MLDKLLPFSDKIPSDILIASYAILEDDLFYLLHILQGRTIVFPTNKALSSAVTRDYLFIEDDEKNYADDKNTIIKLNEIDYKIVKRIKVLNHSYIVLLKVEGENE